MQRKTWAKSLLEWTDAKWKTVLWSNWQVEILNSSQKPHGLHPPGDRAEGLTAYQR